MGVASSLRKTLLWWKQTTTRDPSIVESNNPVYTPWMGEDISYRMYFIQDNFGPLDEKNNVAPLAQDPQFSSKFERFEYLEESDHEHCGGCFITIAKEDDEFSSKDVISSYYRRPEDPIDFGNMLCPVCFTLLDSVCKGILEIKVSDRKKLDSKQLQWN